MGKKAARCFAETAASRAPLNDRDVRRCWKEPEGSRTPFQPRGRNPAGFQHLLVPGQMGSSSPRVKYLIKPHQGANVLLKLMELYKKC